MALCTLHPSLTSLLSNLEAFELVNLAVIDSNNEHLLSEDAHKNRQTGQIIIKINESEPVTAQNMQASAFLSSLSDESSVLWSEHFLSKEARGLLAPLLALAEDSKGLKKIEVAPKTISELLDFWDDLGKKLGKASRARDLHQRVESQLLDWTSNFYARLRGKRAVVLSSLSPLVIAGSWISDIIRKIGALAPELEAQDDQIVVDWEYLKNFDPHVIIFAPLGKTLDQSKKLFFELEKLSTKDRQSFKRLQPANAVKFTLRKERVISIVWTIELSKHLV